MMKSYTVYHAINALLAVCYLLILVVLRPGLNVAFYMHLNAAFYMRRIELKSS